jgi:signal transduction histidine kinase
MVEGSNARRKCEKLGNVQVQAEATEILERPDAGVHIFALRGGGADELIRMNIRVTDSAVSTAAATAPTVRGTLAGKYLRYLMLLVAVVSVALIANGIFAVWFNYREQMTLLIPLQRQQAEAAADKLSGFIKEIEHDIRWTTRLPWMLDDLDDRYLDAWRLLRQTPAITEFAQLDRLGREKIFVSRSHPDRRDSAEDFSETVWFKGVIKNNNVYYGPVKFLDDSEPHMVLAIAGERSDTAVSFAEINLNFLSDILSDVVTQIKGATKGQAYVVDGEGRLIAHPDITLVLQNTNVSDRAQAQAALYRSSGPSMCKLVGVIETAIHRGSEPSEPVKVAEDKNGRCVLTAYAPVAPFGWLVFVELPIDEAISSLYDFVESSGLLLLAALVLALLASLFLARNMVRPIQALSRVAASIGSGHLGRRIAIHSGDELEALGHQFNSMAAQLQESYATLERKVEERTHQLELANHQLELANLAKSRFLATAGHDLRQPLHALGLFIAQLHNDPDAAGRARIVERIDAAVAMMNRLFNALWDMTQLEAGVRPDLTEFPIARLLAATETTFGETAGEKGLQLRVVSSSLWVRSDVVRLGQILLNLVSNAVRYTDHGGVVVGCRRHGKKVRIEVWDSGPGIPGDQQRKIFDEFYRIAGSGRDGQGGLGLGLANVDRLCQLLEHPIGLTSTLGKGSCFAVEVPLADGRANQAPRPAARPAATDATIGKLIVVIDDDPLVLESTGGLLRSWGCLVVAADSCGAALARLAEGDRKPDLIICDYRLSEAESEIEAEGEWGIEAIEHLRSALQAPVPAFLISGDTVPERLIEARASGYQLLPKPVTAIALRALVSHLLKCADARP